MATILDCLSQSDCNAVSKSIITDVPINANFENLLISPESFCQLKNCITCNDISETILLLQLYNLELISSDFGYKTSRSSEISKTFNRNMIECNLANTTLCKEINVNYECITNLSINGALTGQECMPSENLKDCLGLNCSNCGLVSYNLTLNLDQILSSNINGDIVVDLTYITCVNGTPEVTTFEQSFISPMYSGNIALNPLSIKLSSPIYIRYRYLYDGEQIEKTTIEENQCKNLVLVILP